MRVALPNEKIANVQVPCSSKIESGQASSFPDRCRENMARTRQSRPDSGLDVSVKNVKTF